ncbi:lipocalin-like domain-containing protein [Chryseobacterium chendengshani]|uniref:lipocalin family protein n=1 Tax=unclassified Chryseobacterium TaxID=2593645 RepID=UPI001C64440D|nr:MULTISPECIES: lipocalin family protein [unclassified Chryseobacterium]MBW7674069.1 lipocalin family protein [Chryseobacterium sp. LJ756]MBW8522989.1 lipocalin family protein [Chryseobacterium sp. LJ668]QYK16518.1 lipocalin family protein [Chryseobacterium sp. LJ668]
MKKYLLLFAFAGLALTSCEDDDVQHFEMDMLKGEWKVSKAEIISGADNKTVISTDTPTGCNAKSTTEFRIDFYAAYTAVTGVGATCTSSKTEGTYTYDAETKELVIKYNNDTARKYKVVILSSSELRLMEMFDSIDYDGDTVIDYTFINYVR